MADRREMDTLYTDALQSLTLKERQRFLTLGQKGPTATDREIGESTDLIRRALLSLPLDKRNRLFALVEKAVQLQLAQQKNAEN